MKTNDIEEFIDYVCSTGATPETDLFTREQILKIGKATRCSDIIGEKTIADAILDRLIHQSHRLELHGESMRKKRGINKG